MTEIAKKQSKASYYGSEKYFKKAIIKDEKEMISER